MSNAWRGLRVTRRAPADARLRYPRDDPDSNASIKRFDFAFMVANLQARGRPAPRHEFVAHHASVLLSLLLERARFRGLMERRQREDDDPPRTVKREQAQRAVTEGARSLFVTLDAVTRTTHTKKYTIECNRAAYRAAIATLMRADDEAWKRVEDLLFRKARTVFLSEGYVRFECRPIADAQGQTTENKALCAFLYAREGQIGNSVLVSAGILHLLGNTDSSSVKDDSAELYYRAHQERYLRDGRDAYPERAKIEEEESD